MTLMKHLKYLLLAAMPLAFVACDKEDEPDFVPALEFATDKLSADAAGGILSVDVKADMPYEVVMPQDAEWVKLAEEAQTEAATLTFEVEKNTAATARTAAVIIRASEGITPADTLHITQSGLDDAADITAEFDPAFATLLQEKGYIGNSQHITPADVKGIMKLDVSGTSEDYEEGKGLTSLKGIEYFTALLFLDCGGNQLTALDVSQNTALTELGCYWNRLASLNVSRNTALLKLACNKNELTSLDVSQNTALTELSCDANQLTSLDVSRNAALTLFSCAENQLTSLDVSQNTALNDLICARNQLTTLDVSRNTALTALSCRENQLTALDVSQNTELAELSCDANQLTSLDVSGNPYLYYFSCVENQLTTLDVSQNTALVHLFCQNNQLTALDVSRNTALLNLDCENNRLTSLDVSHNTKLGYLNCYDNPGLDGIFKVALWPGSELTAWYESWEYNGQTVTVEYTGR